MFYPLPRVQPEGNTSHVEGVTADEQGNIYAAEVAETNFRKFTRIHEQTDDYPLPTPIM